MNESGHWAVFTGQVCYLIFEPLLAGPEPAVLQWSMKHDPSAEEQLQCVERRRNVKWP